MGSGSVRRKHLEARAAARLRRHAFYAKMGVATSPPPLTTQQISTVPLEDLRAMVYGRPDVEPPPMAAEQQAWMEALENMGPEGRERLRILSKLILDGAPDAESLQPGEDLEQTRREYFNRVRSDLAEIRSH